MCLTCWPSARVSEPLSCASPHFQSASLPSAAVWRKCAAVHPLRVCQSAVWMQVSGVQHWVSCCVGAVWCTSPMALSVSNVLVMSHLGPVVRNCVRNCLMLRCAHFCSIHLMLCLVLHCLQTPHDQLRLRALLSGLKSRCLLSFSRSGSFHMTHGLTCSSPLVYLRPCVCAQDCLRTPTSEVLKYLGYYLVSCPRSSVSS